MLCFFGDKYLSSLCFLENLPRYITGYSLFPQSPDSFLEPVYMITLRLPSFLTANSRFPWVLGFHASWSPLNGKEFMNVDILFSSYLFDGRIITISLPSPQAPFFLPFFAGVIFLRTGWKERGGLWEESNFTSGLPGDKAQEAAF